MDDEVGSLNDRFILLFGDVFDRLPNGLRASRGGDVIRVVDLPLVRGFLNN